MTRGRRAAAWVLVLSGTAACHGEQTILGSESAAPAAIESLWWVSLVGTGLLSLLVMAGLGWAVVRARRAAAMLPDAGSAPEPDRKREDAAILLFGAGLPAVFLLGFLAFSVRTGAEVALPPDDPVLTVEVVGHMFWWEVRYPDQGIVTANEIRIPTGGPVEVHVTSADVIHSFWVPQLSPGKIDMIPGRTNRIWMHAETPGRYRGQCTEFCGLQHALMSLLVIAEPPEDFQAWMDARQAVDARPANAEEERGLGVFMAYGCASCHVIEGVVGPGFQRPAGPELTDMGARLTLGALTLDNDPESLAGWIIDPHRHKPGVRMPSHRMPDEDLSALVTYLARLGRSARPGR